MEKVKQKIMVIDDNVTNLNIARIVLEEFYDVYLIPSGEKALSLFDRITPNLILLDVEMPDMDGFDVLRKLKQLSSPICDIPVIFVTAKDDNSSELKGLSLGAVDYIIKPFSFPLLLKRVEVHLALVEQKKELYNYGQNLKNMVDEKTKVISELQYAIVHVLAVMAESRDGSTGSHLLRTQNYLKVLLEEVMKDNLYPDELKDINIDSFVHASQLHDIGKISIPDSILLKPGKFTNEEFEIMKTHTTLGENAIRYAMNSVEEKEFLEIAAAFAGSHHEKWDGSGYPKSLSGTNIPIAGRLMAIADVYDALISERPYKVGKSHEKAVQIILKNKNTHFDPLITNAFMKITHLFKDIANSYENETNILLENPSLKDQKNE